MHTRHAPNTRHGIQHARSSQVQSLYTSLTRAYITVLWISGDITIVNILCVRLRFPIAVDLSVFAREGDDRLAPHAAQTLDSALRLLSLLSDGHVLCARECRALTRPPLKLVEHRL